MPHKYYCIPVNVNIVKPIQACSACIPSHCISVQREAYELYELYRGIVTVSLCQSNDNNRMTVEPVGCICLLLFGLLPFLWGFQVCKREAASRDVVRVFRNPSNLQQCRGAGKDSIGAAEERAWGGAGLVAIEDGVWSRWRVCRSPTSSEIHWLRENVP